MEQFYYIFYSQNLSSPFQVLWLYQQFIKYFALEELGNSEVQEEVQEIYLGPLRDVVFKLIESDWI